MGHMALSWATVQVLAAVPGVPGRETKTSSIAFLLLPLLSLFGLQTELKQQLHTPDASTSGKAQSAVGQRAGLRVTEKLNTTMVFASFPPFPEPPPSPRPPHTPLPCPLSLLCFWSVLDRAWEYLLCYCRSQQFSRAHKKTGFIPLCLILNFPLHELLSKILSQNHVGFLMK